MNFMNSLRTAVAAQAVNIQFTLAFSGWGHSYLRHKRGGLGGGGGGGNQPDILDQPFSQF